MLKGILLILATCLLSSDLAASEANQDLTLYAKVNVYAAVKTNVNSLLQTVSLNLQQQGIKLVVTEDASEDRVNLELTANENEWIDGTSLYLKTLTPAIMALNPLLYSQFDQAADIPITWTDSARLQETAIFITAIGFYSMNACELAEPYFEAAGKLKAIGTAQNWSYFNFYRGNCSLEANDIEHAFEYFNKALYWNDGVPYFNAPTVNLTWMLLNYNQSQLWSNKDMSGILLDPDLALTRIICVLDCTSDKKVDLYSRRAQLYALAERYTDAIADLTTAIELTPNNLNLYLLRGKMYLAQYEWDSALADYNKAIELDPTSPDAYYERGVLYYSILQTGVELREEAFDDFHRYLELAPDGDHAEDAERYTEQIQKELAALNG